MNIKKDPNERDILTKAECDEIHSTEFGEMPLPSDHWSIRKKKRAFRLKHFGIQPVCKACIFKCYVLNYSGFFSCYKFIKRR